MDSILLLTVALVGLGGIACLVVAATGLRGANRLSNGLIGLVCLAYVCYILLSTGDVWVFPLAALVPFGALARVFRGPQLRTA